MTIPAVGPITALTWALEVGNVQRFSSIKKTQLSHSSHSRDRIRVADHSESGADNCPVSRQLFSQPDNATVAPLLINR